MPGNNNQIWKDVLGMVAGPVGGAVLGMYNDGRSLAQQKRLQQLQMQGQKEMTNYQMQKNLEMWEKTGYGGQLQQMLKAGINPALMYGMGGGGGQTANAGTGNVSGGNGPSTGGEVPSMMQMGIQYQLLKAQKENIEADTANKKAEAGVKGVQVPNIEEDTKLKKSDQQLKDQQQWETGLRAAWEDAIQKYNMKGEATGDIHQSAKFEMFKETLDEIRQRIKLAQQQGGTQEEMQKKIQNETKLLQSEIDWNALDIKGENIGKTIERIIKLMLR